MVFLKNFIMKLRTKLWHARIFGYILVFGSVFWLLGACANISGSTYILWITQCKTLPEQETFTRSEVCGHLRGYQLEVNGIVRDAILPPAIAIFVGASVLAIGKKET